MGSEVILETSLIASLRNRWFETGLLVGWASNCMDLCGPPLKVRSDGPLKYLIALTHRFQVLTSAKPIDKYWSESENCPMKLRTSMAGDHPDSWRQTGFSSSCDYYASRWGFRSTLDNNSFCFVHSYYAGHVGCLFFRNFVSWVK